MAHFRVVPLTEIAVSVLKRPWSGIFSDRSLLHAVLVFLMVSDVFTFNFGPHPHAHVTGIDNKPCSHCSVGYGVQSFCNSTHDTVCEPCLLGHSYSPAYEHMSTCQICSLCGPGLFVDRRCHLSSDTLCDSCTTSHSPRTWDFYESCLPLEPLAGDPLKANRPAVETDALKQGIPGEEYNDHNSGSSDRQIANDDVTERANSIELQLARDDYEMRRELNALKKTVNEELTGLRKLGSAVNHVLDRQELLDSAERAPSKDKQLGKAAGFEKNPNTIVAVVLLATFGTLGIASLAGVMAVICINRRRVLSDTTYGGVKTYSDVTSLLTVDNSIDSEEDAMI